MKRVLTSALLAGLSLVSASALADPPACSTQLRSCASWTAYTTTSSMCIHTFCSIGPTVRNQALVEEQQRFRICFYTDGTQCKETQTQEVETCGGC